MPKFFTKYDEREPIFSESGEGIRLVRELVLDDEGNEELVITGKSDLQAEIQSHRDSVDLSLMLERYSMGDDSALDKIHGFYADVSDLPVNMIDVINMNRKGEQLFKSMPSDFREVFGDNYANFLADPEKFNRYVKENSDKFISQEKNEDVEEVVSNDDKE